ncbi:hypothetical protein SNEBB_003376 [Seison nebaliae]|nr:hypothetical protein SNEBB_003376 [Seison nebaliae]
MVHSSFCIIGKLLTDVAHGASHILGLTNGHPQFAPTTTVHEKIQLGKLKKAAQKATDDLTIRETLTNIKAQGMITSHLQKKALASALSRRARPRPPPPPMYYTHPAPPMQYIQQNFQPSSNQFAYGIGNQQQQQQQQQGNAGYYNGHSGGMQGQGQGQRQSQRQNQNQGQGVSETDPFMTIHKGSTITIGRDILKCPNDKKISREHCQIQFELDKTIKLTLLHKNPITVRKSSIDFISKSLKKKNDSEILDMGNVISLSGKDSAYHIEILDQYPKNTSKELANSKLSGDKEGKDEIESSTRKSTDNNTKLNVTKENEKKKNSQEKDEELSEIQTEKERKKITNKTNDEQLSKVKNEKSPEFSKEQKFFIPKWIQISASNGSSHDEAKKHSSKTPTKKTTIKKSGDPPALSSTVEKVKDKKTKSKEKSEEIKSKETSIEKKESKEKLEEKKESKEKSEKKDSEEKKSKKKDSLKRKFKKKIRPNCTYGKKCYRKNLDHKKQYAHPKDSDWNDSDDDGGGDGDGRSKKSRKTSRKARKSIKSVLADEEDDSGSNEYDLSDEFIDDESFDESSEESSEEWSDEA